MTTILCAGNTGAIILAIAIILFAIFEIGSFVYTLLKKRKAKKGKDKEVIEDINKGEEDLKDDRSSDT